MQLLQQFALDALNKQTNKKTFKRTKNNIKIKYIFLAPNGYSCTRLQGNETFENLGSNFEFKFRVALYLFRLAQKQN